MHKLLKYIFCFIGFSGIIGFYYSWTIDKKENKFKLEDFIPTSIGLSAYILVYFLVF